MSKWTSVMSGTPKESVLGLALFDIIVSVMDSGIECTFSKFADDMKMTAAVDKLDRKDAILLWRYSRPAWTRSSTAYCR